jgi:hypothetical protein
MNELGIHLGFSVFSAPSVLKLFRSAQKALTQRAQRTQRKQSARIAWLSGSI